MLSRILSAAVTLLLLSCASESSSETTTMVPTPAGSAQLASKATRPKRFFTVLWVCTNWDLPKYGMRVLTDEGQSWHLYIDQDQALEFLKLMDRKVYPDENFALFRTMSAAEAKLYRRMPDNPDRADWKQLRDMAEMEVSLMLSRKIIRGIPSNRSELPLMYQYSGMRHMSIPFDADQNPVPYVVLKKLDNSANNEPCSLVISYLKNNVQKIDTIANPYDYYYSGVGEFIAPASVAALGFDGPHTAGATSEMRRNVPLALTPHRRATDRRAHSNAAPTATRDPAEDYWDAEYPSTPASTPKSAAHALDDSYQGRPVTTSRTTRRKHTKAVSTKGMKSTAPVGSLEARFNAL